MTREEEKAMRDAFKPYIAALEDTAVLALVGKEGRDEALSFWADNGQMGRMKNVTVSWNVQGKNYVWSCSVSRQEDGWQRIEEMTSAEATVDRFWGLIAKEAKAFKNANCVVMMTTPELNEVGRKVCKNHGIKCITWSQKIGLIADGFEKKGNRIGG